MKPGGSSLKLWILVWVGTIGLSASAEDLGHFVGALDQFYVPPKRLANLTWHLSVEKGVSPRVLEAQLQDALSEIDKPGREGYYSCPTSVPPGARVLFAFEGYKSENPYKYVLYKKTGLSSVAIELLGFYCKNKLTQIFIEDECEEIESKISLKFLGIRKVPFLLDHLIAPYMSQAEFHDVEWVYSPHSGAKEKAACAERLYANDPTVRLFIVGHSYGGIGALEMAHYLNKAKVTVEGVLTVDPVPRKLQKLKFPLERPVNVKTFYNVYQEVDNNSLHALGGIHGVSISGVTSEKKIPKVLTSPIRDLIHTFAQAAEAYFKAQEPAPKPKLKPDEKKPAEAQPPTTPQKQDPPVAPEKPKAPEKKPKKIDDDSHIEIPKAAETHEYFLRLLRKKT